MTRGRVFGVTVLPEWAQAEGVDAVLDRLQAAGVNEIATSPYVMAPDEAGVREPPADGGAGEIRLLDRPLWGRRALRVRTAPSFAPERALYDGLPYRPPEPDALTAREGATVARFLETAKRRGMRVWLQVQSAIPPGYRVQFGGPRPEDAPLGPDGRPVPDRVDANASLAAPAVLAYGEALLRDLARAYPMVDGVRIDWPEYPPYAFDALFFDFSPHALAVARRCDVDVDRMRRDVLAVRDLLTSGLSTDALRHIAPIDSARLDALLAAHPGAADLLTLKRRIVLEMLTRYRAALPEHMALIPQSFPSPWSLVSGFDTAAVAQVAQGICVKLYTMHWPMILADWSRAMRGGGAEPATLASVLARIVDATIQPPGTPEGFVYPGPDEPHPVSDAALGQKIEVACTQAGGGAPVYALTHAYGPIDDVARRARVAWRASRGRLWVNRYGYLSDEKIAALGAIARDNVDDM